MLSQDRVGAHVDLADPSNRLAGSVENSTLVHTPLANAECLARLQLSIVGSSLNDPLARKRWPSLADRAHAQPAVSTCD